MNKQGQFLKEKRLSVVVATQQIGNVVSGIGLYAHNLVEYLLADGHQVCVIAPEDQRPPGKLPYPFISIPQPVAGDTQARWISLSISFARELRRLQREQAFDFVHFTDPREALFCHPNVPMVGNINDTYAATIMPLSFYHHYFNDWLLRWVYYGFVHNYEPVAMRRLQAIIANSDYTARVIGDAYHISEQRIHVCHKSIANERYASSLALREKESSHPPRGAFCWR